MKAAGGSILADLNFPCTDSLWAIGDTAEPVLQEWQEEQWN